MTPPAESYRRQWIAAGLLAAAAVSGWFWYRARYAPLGPPLPPPAGSAEWFVAVKLPETPTARDETRRAKRRLAQWLARLRREGFTPMTLSAVAERFAKGQGLPEKTVVLVFDPAYRHTYESVAPVLMRYRCPAVWLTNARAVREIDRKFLSQHALEQAQQSGWWDVGFHDAADSPFRLMTMAAGGAEGPGWAWSAEDGQTGLNFGFRPGALNRLKANATWTAEELVNRLRAELPLHGPSSLTARWIQNRLWGVALDAAQYPPERFSLLTNLDTRSASLSWAGTRGLRDLRVWCHVPTFSGELWLFLRSDRAARHRVRVGFSRDGVVNVAQDQHGRRRVIASLACPALQDGQFTCELTLSGRRLTLAIDGVAWPEVMLAEEAGPADGRVELVVSDHVRSVAQAEAIRLFVADPRAPMPPIPPEHALSHQVPWLGGRHRAPPSVTWAEAIALYRAGRYAEAAQAYRQLAARFPNDAGFQKDLLWVLWKTQQYREAVGAATQCLRLRRGDAEAWALRARGLLLIGKNAQAFRAAQAMLRAVPDDVTTRLTVAQLYLDLKYDAAAEDLLLETRQYYPDVPEIYPLLAKVHLLQGDYRRAAQAWERAVAFFPERPDYRFQQAQALYYHHQVPAALALMQELLTDPTVGHKAADFLSSDAAVSGNLRAAVQILEQHLRTAVAGDEPQLLKLAQFQIEIGDLRAGLATLRRCLALYPTMADAFYLRARTLAARGRLAPAIRTYEQIVRLNPHAWDAWLELSDLYEAYGRLGPAMRALDRAQPIDPTNPYLRLRQADLLAAAGDEVQARELLTTWLAANSGPALPVLLYHGLTPLGRDPLLMSPVHLTAAAFQDQMQALQEAGYQSVTIEQVEAWVYGRGRLPPKAVLITFDDARLDSFRHADPVLKECGFNAVMFVPTVNVERNLPGYATWSQLNEYQRTGRWEMQSHGDLASISIPVDAAGHRELFLVNRRWQEDGTLEREADWKRRLTDDYWISQRTLAWRMGRKPIAYAWPEGNYGQNDLPNTRDPVTENLAAARAFYQLSFHQDAYGFNPPNRDPMFLTRVEPRAGWTGRDLIRHLTDSAPATMMRLQLLRQAARKGRTREAYAWLTQLKRHEAPAPLLLVEEARILAASGDRQGATRLTDRAVALENTPPMQKDVQTVRQEERASWTPGFQFRDDTPGREDWVFHQSLEGPLAGNHRGSLHHAEAEFTESGAATVRDRRVGAGYTYQWGLAHRLGLYALQHVLSGGSAADAVTVLGSLRSAWTDAWSTKIEGGYAPVETARALNANTRETHAEGTLIWQQGRWEVQARGRGATFSDDNRRWTAGLDVARQLPAIPGFKAVASATIDHMQDVTPNYYSPQRLRILQAGGEYTWKIRKGVDAVIRYMPGYGQETGTDPKLIHFLSIALPMSWGIGDRARLEPTFYLSKTPTYERKAIGLTFRWRF